MPFEFTCPHCFKKTLVDDQLAGQSGPCNGCGRIVTLPPGSSKVAEASAADRAASPVRAARLSWWSAAKQLSPAYRLAVAVCLALAVLLGGIAIGKLTGGINPIRLLQQRQARILCLNNLGRIAQALNAYAAAHGSYPPAVVYDQRGTPLHSWRVLILPELGQHELYRQYDFDQPWDSQHNQALFSQCPKVYRCPSRGRLPSSASNYFLICGQGTIFPDPANSLSPEEIGDGRSQTLLVVEAENTIHEWTKPIDIEFANWNSPTAAITAGGNHPAGFTAAFADNQPAWLPQELPNELVRAMITANGGEPVDRGRFIQPASQ